MSEQEYDLVVVGGGPAGLAAAQEAYDQGVKDILIIERDFELGGILQQCIHNGFGLHFFDKELTGPEYAQRFIENIKKRSIDIKLDTMVLEITSQKRVYAVNSDDGILVINAQAIILAMGCREKTREAISIAGSRPAGVYSAGAAQRYINMEQWMPGEKVVILGSGDIGLIMARRMHLEGAKVEAVLEIKPFSGGLTRNIVQCLDDFNIPLRLQQTVVDIKGQDRLESVIVAQVDNNLEPISGSEYEIKCDILLLSVGLIPENELSTAAGIELDDITGGPIVNEGRETNLEGVFACGNVLHVHDLVDWVTEESIIAAKTVALYINNKLSKRETEIKVEAGKNVGYVVPQKIANKIPKRKLIKLYLRVKQPLTDVKINLFAGNRKILDKKKKRVEPGEMITIALPQKLIDKSDIERLRVDIDL